MAIGSGNTTPTDGAESNVPRQAVALRYDRGKDTAPLVVAGGAGEIAEMIVREARRAGVPLVQDPDLVRWLIRVPVGTEIPPVLYEAVARVFAFLVEADASRGDLRKDYR
ncbi:MAG: EscU/YscU/HrcU family type III secretion system export apparatus switch protein [Alicyclobacillaceae bacterium]|nr:EscU/YscU/HrcU family type III secretion system export apparatus switch protein [Alicyclobacillaceae bacterium]